MRDGWAHTTLGEVASINPETTSGWSSDRRVQYIDLSAVSSESGIRLDPNNDVLYGDAPGRAKRVIRAADVLVATVRPYLRGFAQVPGDLDGQVASTGFSVLRPKDGVVPGYIWALVRTDGFVDFLMKRATGSNYPAVRPADVAAFPVSLPPVAEQRRIVDLISSIDSAIQAGRDLGERLRTLRSQVMGDLMAPKEGWVETTLEDVADVQMGQSPPGSTYNEIGEGLPFLQGSAEFGDRHPLPAKWCSSPKKKAKAGDLLVSVRAPVGDINIADQEVAVGRGLAVVAGKAGRATTGFLSLVIEQNVVQLDARSGGGMFKSITKKGLIGLPLTVPPLLEQRRIVRVISSIDSAISAAQVQVDTATRTRSEVLQSLLSGEHEIPASYDRFLEGAA